MSVTVLVLAYAVLLLAPFAVVGAVTVVRAIRTILAVGAVVPPEDR